MRCDVTEWAEQQALVATRDRRLRAVDVAFANAGFGGPRGFEEGDPEHWKSMVLTNVLGAALHDPRHDPALIDESTGHLLLTGCVAGRRALPGSLYCATKWAVTAWARPPADFNDTGVRVTLIEPGMVDTPFFDSPPKIDALRPDDIARAVM